MDDKTFELADRIMDMYDDRWSAKTIASRLALPLEDVREVINMNSAGYKKEDAAAAEAPTPAAPAVPRVQSHVCMNQHCPWKPEPGKKCILPSCFAEVIK